MIVYNQPTQVTSGTPTNLGNANLFDGVASTSGDYGRAGANADKGQWQFMHNTSGLCTINHWLKIPITLPNNVYSWDSCDATDSVAGWRISTTGNPSTEFRVIIANETGNNAVIDTNLDGATIDLNIPTDNEWHMYTYTWDYNSTPNFTYRVDGATSGTYYATKNKSGNAAVNVNSDYAPFVMASGYQASGGTSGTYGRLNSNVCEFAIWNRVLTDAEITTLYNSGSGVQLDTGAKVWKEKGVAA